jgi:VanZ family protein
VLWGARIVVVAGLAGVAWASLAPTDDVPLSHAFSDKVLHFAAYALLGVAAALAQRTPRIVLSVVLLSAFGLLIEILQGMTDYRSFDLRDLVADMLGAAVGLLVGLLVVGRIRASRRRSA